MLGNKDARNPDAPHDAVWDQCNGHAWEEVESMFSNEYRTEVRCAKCCAPGELDRATGEIYWPAT